MYRLQCTIKGSDLFVDGCRLRLTPVEDLGEDELDNLPSIRYNRQNEQRREHEQNHT